MVSPILDTLTGPFGVSAAQIGLFVTAIAFPAIFLIPIGGVLTDRIGRKPLLVAGLLLFGGGGTAVALTSDFTIALGLRFIQGVGMAATFPAIVSSIRDLYSDTEEATAQGLRVGVSGASQAVFTTAAGFLVVLAWQYPFFLYAAAFPVVLALVVWFDEPMTPRSDPGRDHRYDGLDMYLTGVLEVISYRRVLMILLAHGLAFFALFSFMTYNSLIVVGAAGGGAAEAGIVVALFSIVYAAVATQVGRITSRFGGRRIPLIASQILLGGGLVIFAMSPHSIVAIVGATILALGMGVVAPMYRSLISGFAHQEIRGGLVSVGEAMGWVAVTLAPIAIGLTVSRLEGTLGTIPSLQMALIGAGVVVGIVGVFAVIIAERSVHPPAEQTVS